MKSLVEITEDLGKGIEGLKPKPVNTNESKEEDKGNESSRPSK